MERFDDILSESDVEAIHDYLIDESCKAYREQEKRLRKIDPGRRGRQPGDTRSSYGGRPAISGGAD
jgi:hypothetical protein